MRDVETSVACVRYTYALGVLERRAGSRDECSRGREIADRETGRVAVNVVGESVLARRNVRRSLAILQMLAVIHNDPGSFAVAVWLPLELVEGIEGERVDLGLWTVGRQKICRVELVLIVAVVESLD